MNQRQQKLFIALIKEYIKTARPVGSSLLAQKAEVDVSPATVRNDLVELEKTGYLTHPHTSAGRIPTESGYRYYVQHFLSEKDISSKEKQLLETAQQNAGDKTKNLAKKLAEITHEAVVIGFSQYDFYYTGLSHFFQKPEFANVDILHNMSKIIDHLDESIGSLFAERDNNQILIGKDNPVSPYCSIITTRFTGPHQQPSIISILGPMRMDYDRNVPRLQTTKNYLELNHTL